MGHVCHEEALGKDTNPSDGCCLSSTRELARTNENAGNSGGNVICLVFGSNDSSAVNEVPVASGISSIWSNRLVDASVFMSSLVAWLIS